MNVDKNILTQVYGIDDDNFVLYLNKFNTLKKIINLSKLDVLPVEKVRELYNNFLYYFSLGHNTLTIVNETIPTVKRLFFLNGEGNLKYAITKDERFKENYSVVHIVGRVCHTSIHFITAQEININSVILESLPSPTINFCSSVETSKGYRDVLVNSEGLKIYKDALPADTTVRGNITFIVDK